MPINMAFLKLLKAQNVAPHGIFWGNETVKIVSRQEWLGCLVVSKVQQVRALTESESGVQSEASPKERNI